MVLRFSFEVLRRFRWGASRTKMHLAVTRLVSSYASRIERSDELFSILSNPAKKLQNEILKMKCPRREVTTLLQEWVDSGRCIAVSELRFISRILLKSRRYRQSLEVLEWMEKRKGVQISVDDHAVKMELIIRVHGLVDAEKYFMQIHDKASQKAACLPLLRGYVNDQSVEKAEAFMKKLNASGLLINQHPFNEMMKLYVATCQHEKVPIVIMQMKRNKIPLNILSYNLWIGACGEISDAASAEKIFREMRDDKNVGVGWSTLVTLAKVYSKGGFIEKATSILNYAENKLNISNRLGYFFLITSYASLNDKGAVLRVWEASKSVKGKMKCANYMCILSCLVKIGDLAEAERIFMEWESKRRNYDVRVSNILLGAYTRNGLIDKAESLHNHALMRGGTPNFKTWEILMEGWVKQKKMVQAVDAMKNMLFLMRGCHWRPSKEIVMGIAEYYESHGKLEEANIYVRLMHRYGVASVPLYRLLLRMHIQAGKSPSEILEMMKDKIENFQYQ